MDCTVRYFIVLLRYCKILYLESVLCVISRGLVIALVVSLIFILLLRFTAGLLLWFTIIAVILVIAYGRSVCVCVKVVRVCVFNICFYFY